MSGELTARVVVDSSVLMKLWSPQAERHQAEVDALVARWEDGRISFVAPDLLMLEAVNVAARKWGFNEPALLVLIQTIRDLDIVTVAPELERVAQWSARGLSAYDASYVAAAEQLRVPLVTDDDQIVSVARDHALALADVPL